MGLRGLCVVGAGEKGPSHDRSGWPCIINCVHLSRRRLSVLCVCVSKTTSLCLAGTWDQPSCPMLTKAAAVTDVLWFRDSFWDI